MPARHTQPPEVRFWSKVERTAGCWLWRGNALAGTRPQFEVSARPRIRVSARAYSWRLAYGEVPKGKLVFTSCGDKLCVRPDHLRLGTQSDFERWTQRDVAAIFWSRVDQQPGGGCREWTGSRFPNGYGQFVFEGRGTGAHRVAWQLTYGAIPEGIVVCHRCDNPPCCRPEHLFLGTNADNSADMTKKGRQAHNRHAAKLTDDEALEVRRSYAAGDTTYDELAAQYGVTRMAIFGIVKCKSYRHVASV